MGESECEAGDPYATKQTIQRVTERVDDTNRIRAQCRLRRHVAPSSEVHHDQISIISPHEF